MGIRTRSVAASVMLAALGISLTAVFGNGGPFVVRYPSGDPAAKGTLARLDPNLKPARESRLKVLKEDLNVVFLKEPASGGRSVDAPLVQVTAVYKIQNPTGKKIKLDFGFPILRGVYLRPGAMFSSPYIALSMEDEQHRDVYMPSEMISNSAIYGVVRQRCREIIDRGIRTSPKLAALVRAVKAAKPGKREAARTALARYLTEQKKWDRRNAALMVEYASNRFQAPRDVIVVTSGYDRYGIGENASWPSDLSPSNMAWANLGPLRAIGEQKATQFFAQLASCTNRKASQTYEAIFAAWGGDVRERSVDLRTGKVRPREYTVRTPAGRAAATARPRYDEYPHDPTVYARVDYLDPQAKITEAERASCRNVLKNLDVVFTFAPMNLIHYTATFPARSTRTLTVQYAQYAYADTKSPKSYQIAYVVHPATMWDYFGPIKLEVMVPKGIAFKASVPTKHRGVEQRTVDLWHGTPGKKASYDLYRAMLMSKRGEIYAAVDSAAWNNSRISSAARR